MSTTSISFFTAEKLSWVQVISSPIDYEEPSILFEWEGVKVTFKRDQLTDLLGVLNFIAGSEARDYAICRDDFDRLSLLSNDSEGHVIKTPIEAIV
jgi:hypothetical protein